MALSSCPKCDNLSFEIQEVTPTDSLFKLNFVQCAGCGAVVGVVEYDNIGARLHKQDAAIRAIAEKLGVDVRL